MTMAERAGAGSEGPDICGTTVALPKQQSDARLTEVFVRMTQEEIKAFDLRTERISKIYVILSEHDAKR